MTTVKPSDLPHQVLREVKIDPVDRAIDEVTQCMDAFISAGHEPHIAAHLTQIALDNVQEG